MPTALATCKMQSVTAMMLCRRETGLGVGTDFPACMTQVSCTCTPLGLS